MLRIRLTALALILSAGLAHAGIENAGTTAGNFLSVGTGAGILSMGGATLGAGRDLNAAAWNPAALGSMTSPEYALSHSALALDVSQDWLAASGRVGRSATRWAASVLYQSDGSFDGRDAFGAPTGSFNVSNMAFGLAFARPFSPDVTGGARVHLLHESLASASGSGFGLDLGVQARRGAFGFGAAARNLGGKMKYDSGSYDLPGVFGLGASWADESKGLRLALDANFPRAYYNDVRLGGEWMWQQRVALRAGYRLELGAGSGEPLGGPSFGLGTGVNGFWFDYAFLAGANEAQGAHRFGVTFHPAFFQQHGAAPRAGAGSSASEPVAASAPKRATPAPATKRGASTTQTPVATQDREVPKAKSAPVAAAAPPAPMPDLRVPEGGSSSSAAARTTAPAAASLAPSAAVQVTSLAKPEAPTAQVTSAATPAAPAAPVAGPAKPAQAADESASPGAPAIAKVAATPAPTVVVVRHAPEPARAAAKASGPRPASVTVQKNETLADIASRWGTSVAAIMMENNLVQTRVKPGQKLKLPKL
ncbi:MAG: PorV/PorQ family protein [Candidatus Eisenbacteria bacterium]|nr:PorV/PorQ family protein [Candidatus Eisenbacteria bacterium]